MVARKFFLIACFVLPLCLQLNAQCFSVDFSGPADACKNESVQFASDGNFDRYEWDFCGGDLELTPSASIFQNSAGAAFKVEIVEEGGQYYGFYTSRSNRQLYRLDFGSDLKSTPAPISLGDLGLTAISPLGWLTIEIVKEDNAFYGFVIDFYNRVYRFSLGSSLTNAPSAATAIYSDGLLANPIDLAVLEDETGKYAFIANLNSNQLVRLNFPGSFNDESTSINVDQFSAGNGNHGGLSFVSDCGSWYAVVSTTSGSLNKIYFDDGLSDLVPVVAPIPSASFPAALRGAALAFESGNYYAFVQSSTNLYKVAFGSSMGNDPVSTADFGNFSLLSDVFGFSMHKVKSDWLVLSSENSGNNIFKVTFPNNCFSTVESSADTLVQVVTNDTPGDFEVSLKAINANGEFTSITKTITITNVSAPEIEITSGNICSASPVNFYSNNTSADAVSFDWDFGDLSAHSTEADPVHTYNVPGTYSVTLSVVNSSGCKSDAAKDLSMYEAPIADFTLPSSVICTNTDVNVINNTVDSFSGNLSYKWFVEDTYVSDERDVVLTFSDTTTKSITLETSIPGCTSELTKLVENVEAGPVGGFIIDGKCEMQTVFFNNNSEGDIQEYSWFIGSNFLSNEVNEQAVLEPGIYSAELHVLGNNGCSTETTQEFEIHPRPVADFDVSTEWICSGETVYFTDVSQIPSGSITAQWLWSFGDGGSSTDKDTEHTYSSHGVYGLSLSVETDAGCRDTLISTITVKRSPESDFQVPATVCLNQNFLVAPDAAGLSYEWDFCPGDLAVTPEASEFLSNAGSAFKIEIVQDGSSYYGFYTSRSRQKLYRLDFGNDIKNIPDVVDLGNLGMPSPTWLSVEIVREEDQYYGFIVDFSNKVYRFTLGTSPANIPFAAEIIYEDGLLANPIDLAIINDASGKYAFIANANSNQLVRIHFDATFSAVLSPEAIDAIEVVGSGNLSGVSFISDCGLWYAITTSANGRQITKLAFWDGLPDDTPVIETLEDLSPAPIMPGGVSVAFEAGDFYAFVLSQQSESNMYRITFGRSMANRALTTENLGNFGMLSNVFGYSMHKIHSTWMVLASENTGDRVWKIDFPNSCFVEVQHSDSAENSLLATKSGTHTIALTATDELGYWSTTSKTVEVLETAAASFDFTSDNKCAGSTINFAVQTTAVNIAGYDWSFGNNMVSTEPEPQITYQTEGEYRVSLAITTDNGCINTKSQSLKVYSPPVSGFDKPAGLICSDHGVIFTNTTSDNFDGNLTYRWYVNDEIAGDERDLGYNFASPGNYTIRLKTTIPGCSDEISEMIDNVQAGPQVAFSIEGMCEQEEIIFINNSEGSISGYAWILDGDTLSYETNATARFFPGLYSMELYAAGENGCESMTSKEFEVYPKPIVDFEVAPELICSGLPVKFTDMTQIPSGNTLASWTWDFADGSTSGSLNPEHAYANDGDYKVVHSVKTNFGCEGTKTAIISVNRSPSTDFTNTTACNGKPVTLDATDPDGKSWLWKVGDKTYQIKKPVHTFRNPGDYKVTLKVTSTNGCESTGARDLAVPVPLDVDFSVEKNCVDNDTKFVDLTTREDQIGAREWNLDGEIFENQTEVVYGWDQPGEKEIKLTVIDTSGCSYAIEKNISIVPAPEAEFTFSPPFASPGVPIHFENLSADATVFEWLFGDGNNSGEHSPDHVYTEVGSYTVKLLAANAFACVDSVEKGIEMTPPSPDVGILAITASDNADGSIKVTIILENEGNTVIEDLPLHIDVSGNLTLEEVIEGPLPPQARYNFVLGHGLRRSSGLLFLCAETTIANDQAPANDRSCIQFENQLLVLPGYPNPVRDFLTIEWVGRENELVKISLLNSIGRKINQFDIDSKEGFNQQVIDVKDLQKGVYLLVLEGKYTRSTQHIVFSN